MINDIKTTTYLKSTSSTPFSNSSNSSFPSSTTSTNTNNIHHLRHHHSSSTLLKKKSLRNLKPSPLNPSTHTTTNTPNSSSTNNNNSYNHTNNISNNNSSSSSSKVSFFKKISAEWNFLLLKLRSISEEVFTSDELVEELFTEVDEEDHFDKIMRSSKGYNSMEENFLQEFKKYKSLDKMVEHHQQSQSQSQLSNDVKSSTTLISDSQTKLNYTLQDFIRQSFSPEHEAQDEDGDIDEDEDENEDILNEMDYSDITYQDLDLYKLKQELEIQKKSLINNNPSLNIGHTLWEFRRSKWLHNAHTPAIKQKVQTRLQQSSIQYIPRDSYVKIYNFLIEKNRILKDNKKINLSDLIKIINVGWIAEEKWERAAKGLP